MDAPLRLYNGACAKLVGDQWPIRRTYCAMVRSLDEAVANITATYKALGLWEDTVVIMTADNGGIPADGGNNYPLRGNKATTYEGGVRGLGWIYGAGLSDAVKGTITHEMMHVVDWGTTIVAGIAQLPLTPIGRPCPTCTVPPAPLDGVNQWAMLTSVGGKSARTDMLLEARAAPGSGQELCWDPPMCSLVGQLAIRVGKWKLLTGNTGVWNGRGNVPGSSGAKSGFICNARSGAVGAVAHSCAFQEDNACHPVKEPVAANLSNPWCPNGWTPPPQAGGKYEAPIPPPEVAANCTDTVAGCFFGGPSFALSTLRYPFVWMKGVLNGYSSTRVSLWDSLMFGRLAMGFANVRVGTRVLMLVLVQARPSTATAASGSLMS